jgi:hypothetical protein
VTRTVRAILIAGDEDGGGTPTPGAPEALDDVEQDLVKRFPSRDIKRLQNRPTKSQVLAAFTAMRNRLSLGELFIVMYAGHGDQATPDRPSQVWNLNEDEQLDDGELADQLLALPDRLDIVVVSDCCYGEGFFIRGPETASHYASAHRVHSRVTAAGGAWRPRLTDAERKALYKQSQALGKVLVGRFQARQNESPMVCISAASKDKEVSVVELPHLASSTADAADRGETYATLKAEFEAHAPTGAAFHVDARPTERFSEPVLGV